MCVRPPVLHGYPITVLVEKRLICLTKCTAHLHLAAREDYPELLQLLLKYIQADEALSLVGPIEGVDAVRPDDAPLNAYLVDFIVHLLPFTDEDTHLLDVGLHKVLQRAWEVKLLLPLLHVVVLVGDVQLLWELPVDNLIDYVVVLIRHHKLPRILHLRQVYTVNGVAITFK